MTKGFIYTTQTVIMDSRDVITYLIGGGEQMSSGYAVFFSMSTMFIIVGVALKIYIETGRMVFIEHLKEDWTHRLPFRLKNNRYESKTTSVVCPDGRPGI